MRIRFLQTTQSGVPGYPFLAGQIIENPTADLLGYVDGVHAEVLRAPDEEMAVVPEGEMAVVRARKPGRPKKVA